MSEWKSNIPEELDLEKKYSPAKTEKQKEKIRQQWADYWNIPGNKEAWQEAVKNGQDEEWLARVTAKNIAQAQDPVWREGQKQKAVAYWNSLSDEEKSQWSEVQKDFWNRMSDDEYTKRCEKAKQVSNDPVLKERLRKEFYDNPTYLKKVTKKNRKLAEDPSWREKVAKNNKAKRSNPTHLEKHQAGVADRSTNNEEWIRKNCRPVSTPYGVFQKTKDVMDLYHAEHGGKRESIAVKLRSWLNSDKKPEWKYLSWEEYNTIKGKTQ